ncbi:Na+/H+ antiporter subunit E [Rhodobacteraceae bacterium LMO-12]|nr:Na+/H+ antiporter subunit E [Rhodobacteraceae bacterium LMO-JJ12]
MRIIGSIIVLCALWLLLSGVYKPLVIGLGLVSVLLSVFFAQRMNRVDGYVMLLILRPVRSVLYFIWLLGEIAKATWTVTRVIMAPEAKTRQHLFALKQSQKSDLGQVVFANSITLTPGTITVETEPDRFIVHALCFSPSDVEDLRDMDRRVSKLEREGGEG